MSNDGKEPTNFLRKLATAILCVAALYTVIWYFLTSAAEEQRAENIASTALRETDENAYYSWIASKLDGRARGCVNSDAVSRAYDLERSANVAGRKVQVRVDNYDVINENGATVAGSRSMSFSYDYRASLRISSISDDRAYKQAENEMAAASLSSMVNDRTSGRVTVKASLVDFGDGEMGTEFKCE